MNASGIKKVNKLFAEHIKKNALPGETALQTHMRLISEKDDGSKVPCSGGLFAPWDTLEENKNDHFANYYAWEKWLHMQDRNDSLENLDMMEKTLLYAIMVDLVKGK